jgi:alpha-N-acetylglucosaminidase
VSARPWDAAAPFAAPRPAGEALPEPTRMSANIDAENDPAVLGDLPRIARAARELAAIADAVPLAAVLQHDVVELVGHVLAQQTRAHIRGILTAFADQDAAGVREHLDRLRRDLLDLDALADTIPDARASTWVEAARSWAGTADEASVMERDARSLVSVWGHQSSGLHDYSGRHWSGLVGGLHLPRWEAWAEWLADAAANRAEPDVDVLRARIVDIEEAWRTSTTPDAAASEPAAQPAPADPVMTAVAILTRLGY